MFKAALFRGAKKWKQVKCPSTDEWLKKTEYPYNETVLKHKME